MQLFWFMSLWILVIHRILILLLYEWTRGNGDGWCETGADSCLTITGCRVTPSQVCRHLARNPSPVAETSPPHVSQRRRLGRDGKSDAWNGKTCATVPLRVLRRIFEPKRDDATGGWRKVHNEGLHNLLSLLDISAIKSEEVLHMGDEKRIQNFCWKTWREDTPFKGLVWMGG
jgi:hypothetical protein